MLNIKLLKHLCKDVNRNLEPYNEEIILYFIVIFVYLDSTLMDWTKRPNSRDSYDSKCLTVSNS